MMPLEKSGGRPAMWLNVAPTEVLTHCIWVYHQYVNAESMFKIKLEGL